MSQCGFTRITVCGWCSCTRMQKGGAIEGRDETFQMEDRIILMDQLERTH